MEFENDPTPQEDEALTPRQPEEIPVAEIPAEEVPIEEAPAAEAPVEEFRLQQPQEQPRKKAGGLIIGIAAVVATIALVVGLLFAFGFFEKKSDPDTLHQAMLTQAKDGLYGFTDGLAAGFENVPTDHLDIEQYGTEFDMHLLLGEAFLSRIEMSLAQMGIDLDLGWLQDIAVRYDMNTTQSQTQYLMDIGFGDNTILTMDVIADLETNAMYIGLPTLSPYYMQQAFIAAEGMEDADLSGMTQEIMGLVQELAGSLPDAITMQPCLRGYADLLLAKLQDPKVGEETVTVSAKSQTLSTVTYQITEAQWCDLCIALLEKAKTDETLKQVIVAYSSYMNGIMENTNPQYATMDLYEELLSAIEEGLAQLEEDKKNSDAGNYIQLIGYLDAKQVLQGIKLTVYSIDEDPFTPFYWADVTEDEKELTLIRLGEGKEETLLTIAGEQAEKDGVYNGTFDFDFGDKKVLTLEIKDFREGTGTIQLTPNVTLLKAILGDDYSTLRVLLGSKLGLRLDLGTESGGLHLTSEGETVIGLTLENIKMAIPGQEIVLPEESKVLDSTNLEDLENWEASIDLSKLLENLRKAGFPTDLLEDTELLPEDAA